MLCLTSLTIIWHIDIYTKTQRVPFDAWPVVRLPDDVTHTGSLHPVVVTTCWAVDLVVDMVDVTNVVVTAGGNDVVVMVGACDEPAPISITHIGFMCISQRAHPFGHIK